MNGRYSVTDLLGRCYWQTDDIEDARETARELVKAGVRLMIRDQETARSCYVTSVDLDLPLAIA